MTKQVNSKGQIWHEQEGSVVRVGFTKSFLEQLDQCWHIIPANTQKFREKGPMMVVETNDALISIMSPLSANFMNWTDKAQNFPDQLTEEDVILQMSTSPVRREEPVAEAPQRVDPWDMPNLRDRAQAVGGLRRDPGRPAVRFNPAPPQVAGADVEQF